MRIYIYIFCLLFASLYSNKIHDLGDFSISRIQYGGGGDWYADPSSLPNLLNYLKENTLIKINPIENKVKIGDDLFNLSNYFYLTGHGNIKLTDEEIITLRQQLLNGSFLHADDNYGMDVSFRQLITQLFPDKNLVELPFSHELFHCFYDFPNGLPKIHEHDNKPPQAFGIFHDQKLILLYTYESDLGDGWEDQNAHNIPNQKRLSALKMGANIIVYSLLR